MLSIRLLSFSLLTLFSAMLCFYSCNSIKQHTTPIIAKAEIRYLADKQDLQADLRLFQGDSFAVSRPFTPPPGSVAFLGSAMQKRTIGGNNRWRVSRQLAYPGEFRFTFPIDSNAVTNKATINFDVAPVVIDSLPELMSKSAKRTNFSIGKHPLATGESLILFLEPEDRERKPRRVIVAGPTKTSTVSIPIAAISEIPFGAYNTYLVRQGIHKSQSPTLISTVTYQYHSRSRKMLIVE